MNGGKTGLGAGALAIAVLEPRSRLSQTVSLRTEGTVGTAWNLRCLWQQSRGDRARGHAAGPGEEAINATADNALQANAHVFAILPLSARYHIGLGVFPC